MLVILVKERFICPMISKQTTYHFSNFSYTTVHSSMGMRRRPLGA